MKIIAATKNSGKIKEIAEILSDFDVQIVSQKDAGINVDVDETGRTFEENALIKARAVSMLCDEVVLADDSGLCVEALDGKPGIYSARYGGGISDTAKNRLLLDELAGLENRKAYFKCVVALVFPDGTEIVADGECHGLIMEEPRGENGFGFDPVFYCEELKKGFAECSEDEKNAVSHRGRALKALSEKMSEFFKERDGR